MKITVHTGSTAGKSVATRYELGKKTKRIELPYLCMQDLITSGILKLQKVGPRENVSDLLTKYLSAEVTFKRTTALGCFDPNSHFIGS